MEHTAETMSINPMEVKRNVTYSLPIGVWLWLKNEARRRKTDASAVIVEMVLKQQEEQAA